LGLLAAVPVGPVVSSGHGEHERVVACEALLLIVCDLRACALGDVDRCGRRPR
jgi:hypothetical protein